MCPISSRPSLMELLPLRHNRPIYNQSLYITVFLKFHETQYRMRMTLYCFLSNYVFFLMFSLKCCFNSSNIHLSQETQFKLAQLEDMVNWLNRPMLKNCEIFLRFEDVLSTGSILSKNLIISLDS